MDGDDDDDDDDCFDDGGDDDDCFDNGGDDDCFDDGGDDGDFFDDGDDGDYFDDGDDNDCFDDEKDKMLNSWKLPSALWKSFGNLFFERQGRCVSQIKVRGQEITCFKIASKIPRSLADLVHCTIAKRWK